MRAADARDAHCWVAFEAIRPTWLMLMMLLRAVKPTQEQLMVKMLTADARDAP